ncbi:MAG: hypothetical protein KF817_07685 [Phycisphaeraceae bacterium]|nr:hypothetical protein [Phycisphaeraceae bacterium]
MKVHLSYHESDHVLNLAYNILRGRSTIEDPELLRNDEVHLDALGAQRISDPTTAGDFCRRFETSDVVALMNVVNEAWLKTVWPRQPSEFVERAITDKDGVIASTTGECREGMDISCKGERGFHPPLVPLANTREPLLLVNRSGNRPSHAAGGRLRRLAWRNVDPAPNWGVACSGARFGGPSAAGPRHLTAPRYRPRRPA